MEQPPSAAAQLTVEEVALAYLKMPDRELAEAIDATTSG